MAKDEKSVREGFLFMRTSGGKIEGVRFERLILLFVSLGIILWLLIASFVVVPAGHKGVVVTGPFGPDRNEINEGWSWNPVYAVSDIEVIRYNTQTRDMTASQGSGLTVRSSDNLDIAMDVSLIFRLPSDKVADVRIERGSYYDLVDRFMRNTPRNVASNFTGEFIGGAGRILVEDATRIQITADLAKFDITVEDFLIRSVDLPTTVDIAIEAKKAAEQAVITAEFKRQAIVIQAMANASKLAIEAEGFRNATVIKANGTAEAIRMVIQQLQISDPGLQNATEAYLTMLYLQALTDTDSNIDFIIITDGGNPIIIQAQP
jgi:regulator of protease activity HflC (stomatin/prohibitin superfamily)